MSRLLPLILLTLAPAIAMAESPRDQRLRLRALVMRANQSYQAGRFTQALSLYQQAFKLQPHPPILYRIGQSREQLGDLRGAAADYERYLQLEPGNRNRPKIEAHIERLREAPKVKPSRLVVTSRPVGAFVWIDGKRLNKLTPAKIPLPTGDYRLKLTMDGRQTVEEVVTVPPRGDVRKKYTLRREEAPKEPERKDPEREDPVKKPPKKPTGPEPYVLTRVNLSPPGLLNNLAWTLTIGGTISTVLGIAICTYDCNDLDDVLPLLLGIGALGAGSYMLFFQDWTGSLPQARGRRRQERPVGVSIGWTF